MSEGGKVSEGERQRVTEGGEENAGVFLLFVPGRFPSLAILRRWRQNDDEDEEEEADEEEEEEEGEGEEAGRASVAVAPAPFARAGATEWAGYREDVPALFF